MVLPLNVPQQPHTEKTKSFPIAHQTLFNIPSLLHSSYSAIATLQISQFLANLSFFYLFLHSNPPYFPRSISPHYGSYLKTSGHPYTYPSIPIPYTICNSKSVSISI